MAEGGKAVKLSAFAKSLTIWTKDAAWAGVAVLAFTIAFHVHRSMPKFDKWLDHMDQAAQSTKKAADNLNVTIQTANDTLDQVKLAAMDQRRYWAAIGPQTEQNLKSLQLATDRLADFEWGLDAQINGTLLPALTGSVQRQDKNLSDLSTKAGVVLDKASRLEDLAAIPIDYLGKTGPEYVKAMESINGSLEYVEDSMKHINLKVVRMTKQGNLAWRAFKTGLAIAANAAKLAFYVW